MILVQFYNNNIYTSGMEFSVKIYISNSYETKLKNLGFQNF
jgi:hypothetical protein